MKISVAMTTYNGEKYILQQLESLRTQTRLPDEVVIRDDQSNDRTVEIVNDYIRDHNLIGWSITRNENNLGWKRNFYESIKQTTGDIVFFSDQDDIWLPDKLEKMSSLMVEKKMGALYGEREIIDGDGKLNKRRMEKTVFSGVVKQIPFTKSFYAVKTLGCCMCVSRDIINKYLTINFPQGGHDSQCGRLALLFSTLWHIDVPVIQYRIHSSNTSGISGDISFGASSLKKRIEGVDNGIKWFEALKRYGLPDKVNPDEYIDALKKRKQYLEGNGVHFLSMMRYKDYYSGKTMLLGDFSYKHGINSLMGKIRWHINNANMRE